MQATIREGTARDMQAISRLLAAIMADHGLAPLPPEKLLAAIEYVVTAPDAWFLLAEDGGELVGMVQVNERFSTWDGGPYGYIEDFFVAEERRGQGIGALMLAQIEAQGRARGWVRLDLDVLTDNAATRLYERAGYERTRYVIYRRVLR
jgi:ribosomal protein S18 acetylase RimI-like enzyme